MRKHTRNRRTGERALTIVSILAVLGFAEPSAFADILNFGANFQAINQSMWGPGNANVFNRTYSASQGWNERGGFNGVGCSLVGCFGASLIGETHGSIGASVTLHSDSGSVNASFDSNIQLVLPSDLTPGHTFTVGSTMNLLGGSLTSSFPNASVAANMNLDLHVAASTTECFFGCANQNFSLLDFSGSIPLASYNQGGDNKLKVLGANVPGFNFGNRKRIIAGGIEVADVTVNNPNLQMTGVDSSRPIYGNVRYADPILGRIADQWCAQYGFVPFLGFTVRTAWPMSPKL